MKSFKEFEKQFSEDAPTNNTSGVPGAGDDSSTVIVRKKGDRKNKRKTNVQLLRRMLPKKFEN